MAGGRLIATVSVALFMAGCGGASGDERDRAIIAAQSAYDRAVERGEDLGPGPCIAEALPELADWVADVAHDPRTEMDDDPGHQCRRYREGEASHFVELTPDGELIRAE